MLNLALNLVLPTAGIVLAALGQLAFTALWPGIQVAPSLVVSIDSYFVVLLTVGLCFVAGGWAQRNAPTIAGAACAVIVPLAWLGLVLRSTMMGVGSIVWFRPLTLFTIFAAMAPLIGVALGRAMSSSKRRNVSEAV
jgi:hypothetical protein